MLDLFSEKPKAPLAERLRPTCLEDMVGQAHLISKGAPLYLALNSGEAQSFILWGPPGTGKTTLARLAASYFECEFQALSAVLAGVKDIRSAVARAQTVLDLRGKRTVLFVDEIHRFNKSQQDALLPFMESGLIVLIGATTENPSFEVNAALLSRTVVYRLEPVTPSALAALYERALPELADITLTTEAVAFLAELSDGDARRFINLLDLVRIAASTAKISVVDLPFARHVSPSTLKRFDKGADAFYNQISAFQKAIRGSSPDGALYWLARMIDGGADARYIARRLMVIASEDIGNADPQALVVAVAASDAYERLGAPEGELNLAHATVYLAMAPKSNAAYLAWKKAKAFVSESPSYPVPLHLCNAPTSLMQELGYKAQYRYAHDEPDAYAAGEKYLPDEMVNPHWYRPVDRGREVEISEALVGLKLKDEMALSIIRENWRDS